MSSDTTDRFIFSESVVQFYTKPELRSAVEMLIDDAFVFSPDSSDWDRVETYYDACLAAQQTKIQFAMDMYRVWQAAWARVPEGWSHVAAKAKDTELSLDPDIRWDESYFERQFRFGDGLTAALWVVFDDDEIEMAFQVKRNDRALRNKLKAARPERLSAWKFESDAIRLTLKDPYAAGIDLVSLREETSAAIQFIDQANW